MSHRMIQNTLRFFYFGCNYHHWFNYYLIRFDPNYSSETWASDIYLQILLDDIN